MELLKVIHVSVVITKGLDYVSLNGNTYTYSVYAVQDSYSDRVALSGCFSCLYNKLKVQNSNKCDDECFAFEQSSIKYYTYPYGGSNCNKCFYSGEVMQFAKKNNNSFFILVLNKIKTTTLFYHAQI